MYKNKRIFRNNNKTIIITVSILLLFLILLLIISSTNKHHVSVSYDINLSNEDDLFDSIHSAVEIVWNYHHLHHALIDNPDGILVFCSSDITVADIAAKLFWKYIQKNPNLYILFSGGIGTGIHSGSNLLGWTEAEAIVFKNRVSQTFVGKEYKDIPLERILVETNAKNSGENVDFSRRILEDKEKQFDRIILVQKPFMERRAFATMRKRWPPNQGGPTEICVQSSSLSWNDYYKANPVDKNKIISIMVGDLQRVKFYAKPYGDFQVPQEMPDIVWKAFEFLVKKGYTENLMENY